MEGGKAGECIMASAFAKCFSDNRRGRVIACCLVLAIIAAILIANIGKIGAGIGEMGAYLGYKFIQRSLIVGLPVALCAALLGVILVLKRYSMIGDGLSHVGFGALTIAVSLDTITAEALPTFLSEGARQSIANLCAHISDSPLVFTLIVVVICAILLLRVSSGGARGDSAIALISTSALAIGVIVANRTAGMNIDVTNYMFGSILAIGKADMILSLALSAAVLLLFIMFYPRIFAVTFDENFARATGANAGLYNMLVAVLTAVTIVVGMRLMGTMLISSLIIFPALTSMRVFSRFRAVVILSAIVSVVCFFVGLMLSCVLSLPAGAGIVIVNLGVYAVFSLIGEIRK